MIIYVRVLPNSLKSEVESFGNNRYLVRVRSPPENNEANIEMLNLLSKYLGVPPTKIKIKSGIANRDKILDVL